MILYFSGTGNSRYTAERMAKILGDEVISLNTILKSRDTSALEVHGRLTVVVPTYCWRIPKVVENYLTQTSLINVSDVWFVMTCGDDTGNAGKYLQKLCEKIHLNYRGVKKIVMPENYIPMFKAPDQVEAGRIISAAEPVIDEAAEQIAKNLSFEETGGSLLDYAKSTIVNGPFYALYVKADKFMTTGACTGCGYCTSVCPLNNISMKDGKPVWGKDCTQCMACICRCPVQAIEYGKMTKGKNRYHL